MLLDVAIFGGEDWISACALITNLQDTPTFCKALCCGRVVDEAWQVDCCVGNGFNVVEGVNIAPETLSL